MTELNQPLTEDKNFNIAPSNDATSGVVTALSASGKSNIRLTAASTIQGISGGIAGQFLVLTNATSSPITIANANAGASSANQILTGLGADMIMRIDQSFLFEYDGTTLKWRLPGSGSQGPQGTQGPIGTGTQGPQGATGASGAALDTSSTVSASGNTQLTNTSNTLQIFTGSAAQTCRLPDTSTCTVGQVWRIESQNTTAGNGSVTIANSGGGTVFTSLSKNNWIQFQVVSTASNALTSWSITGNNTEIITSGLSTLSSSSGAFQTLASLSIPPGNWIFTGENCATGSSTATYVGCGFNTTTGAFLNNFGFDTSYSGYSTTAQAGTAVIAAYIVTLTSATTYNLIARSDNSTGSHNGVFIAKRVY